MLLTTLDEMLSTKYNVMIPLRCDICMKDYTKLQKYVKSEYKKHPNKKNFCCKTCQSNGQRRIHLVNVVCALCHCEFILNKKDYNKRSKNSRNLYCSKSCANKHNFHNRRFDLDKIKNARNRSIEAYKAKIDNADHVVFHRKKLRVADKKLVCMVCLKTFFHCVASKKICSDNCRDIRRKQIGHIGGSKTSALPFHIRSRSSNEKIMFTKILEIYPDAISNKRMFNGWDADIIIPSLKLAIHWNGPWHYKSIMGNELLHRVQEKDELRYKAIQDFGYCNYVIEDLGKMSIEKVEFEFNKFLQYVSQLN